MYTSEKGELYNLLCREHKTTHFSICTLCQYTVLYINPSELLSENLTVLSNCN